jgi:HD-GYP domain-containing protein (c-di-GMP phosphodiesterase class II)
MSALAIPPRRELEPTMHERFPRCAVSQLKLGMFVADLDRPWLDTPFMMQGFLISEAEEIDALRRLCRHVFIDPIRSTVPVAFTAPPPESSESTRTPVTLRDRRSASPSANTPIERHAAFRLQSRITRSASISNETLAPRGAKLVAYAEPTPLKSELPRARATYERTERVLGQIVADLQSGSHLPTERVTEVTEDLVESVVANPDALMWVARLRGEDERTYTHGLRVAVYLLTLGRHLGYPRTELRHLGMIGLLLDVGKINVRRELLERRGGLTDAEFEEVKRHVEHGLTILSRSTDMPREVLEGVGEHHERMNGSGYPRGLQGDAIGIYGRMAGISDCFAAMIAPRPYAEAAAPSDVVPRFFEWSGELFHDAMVERFVQAIGAFPVGTLVELSSGEVGIVVRHNRLRRLQPKLLLLTDRERRPLAWPHELDLMRHDVKMQGPVPHIVRGLPEGAYGLKTNELYAALPLAETA